MLDQFDRGATTEAAMAAGLAATTQPFAGVAGVGSDLTQRSYAEWFVWARDNLTPDPTVAHLAAGAALQAVAAGAGNEAAATAGRYAAGLRPPITDAQPAGFMPWLTFQLGGGTAWAIGAAVVASFLPFVSSFYLPLVPVFGLVASARAFQSGRVWGGVVGVVANLIAGAIDLFASGLIG